jgi:hypothetical protein
MTKVCFGEFENWDEVVEEFDLEPSTAPEPDDYFAAYGTPMYEGSALVLIRKPNGMIDVAEGLHCSCYGLEGQFDPDEMPVAAVAAMIEAIDEGYGRGPFKETAREWLMGGEHGLGTAVS